MQVFNNDKITSFLEAIPDTCTYKLRDAGILKDYVLYLSEDITN